MYFARADLFMTLSNSYLQTKKCPQAKASARAKRNSAHEVRKETNGNHGRSPSRPSYKNSTVAVLRRRNVIFQLCRIIADPTEREPTAFSITRRVASRSVDPRHLQRDV
jgi:hypothetical protein